LSQGEGESALMASDDQNRDTRGGVFLCGLGVSPAPRPANRDATPCPLPGCLSPRLVGFGRASGSKLTKAGTNWSIFPPVVATVGADRDDRNPMNCGVWAMT
jgi:hypothetical protein